MPLKSWIVQRLNRMSSVAGRPDLAQRAPRSQNAPGAARAESREPTLGGTSRAHDSAAPAPEHLGAYAPLIGAIRDELEHFVSSQLRLHLAIAERDRFLLTSIDVECIDGGDGVDLLRRFGAEFRPEQIKRFLARDVIAHLPNASAIDLSQFGGLNASAQGKAPADDDAYAELAALLRADTRSEGPRAFDVTLRGRWAETDAGAAVRRGDAPGASPITPLAGSRLDVEIEDADGQRHLTLSSVVANRRYVIGKGEGCDVTVNGTFASRRHCEIWLENSAWWAGDAGSTNGIRVESNKSVLGRAGPQAGGTARTTIEIVPGSQIVLSALAQGGPADYPRVRLKHTAATVSPATPLAPAAKATTTPVTPIAAPRPRKPELTLTASMATGMRSLTLADKTFPVSVGRSRHQDVVVDWVHEGVSGHHIDITQGDDTGADIQVIGDNGVTVGGVTHPQGHRFRWRVGESMTLGRASGSEPECTLTLRNGS